MPADDQLGHTAIGLIGTGRGCVGLPRKKVIEKIAQSFADASYDKVFFKQTVDRCLPEVRYGARS
ncbi:hypothetical protein NKI48_30550 [Mesorhizobium sp. M0644]|uniref:hypothetical protein n=1 Tax=Mesorhizobium sp. M0644 TaxID=2956979 RepID=UPI00333AA4EC